MSSFYVEPADVSKLVTLLERLADDALTGRNYVQNNTGMAGGEGWLNDLSGAHESVVSQTREWLREVHDPASIKFAGSVNRAVTFYRNTDEGEAARLDGLADSSSALLDAPNPGTDYYIRHAGVDTFGDVTEPEDCYRAVPDYNDHDDYRYQPRYYDFLGVASMGRRAIFEATQFLAGMGMLDRAYDPYELALKPVVGDWAGFRRSADVYRNLADALVAMCSNLYHAQVTMHAAWRGNAADACSVHISRLSRAIGEAYGPLHGIADEYESAAEGQAEFRNTVAQLINDLIDAAVILGIAIAGGAATSWTGVGAVIGGLVGLSEAYIIVRIINQLASLHSRVDAGIAAVKGSMDNFGQLQASDYHLPRLPEVDGGHSTLDALPS